MSKVIIIDFDNTCADWNWPDTGEPKTGVKEALMTIKEMGFEIHIHSCRTSKEVSPYLIDRTEHIRKMIRFFEDNDIPYDRILGYDKPVAFAYIDDRAIEYRENWEEVIDKLKEMK